jgi:hypothetical protein
MPISKLSVVEPPQPTRLNIPNRSDRAIYARIFTAANKWRLVTSLLGLGPFPPKLSTSQTLSTGQEPDRKAIETGSKPDRRRKPQTMPQGRNGARALA